MTGMSLELIAQAVEQAIDSFDVKNALFLSEQALEISRGKDEIEARIMLARCYLTLNRNLSASQVVSGIQHSAAMYLYAVACIRMDRLMEAEEILLKIPETKLCSQIRMFQSPDPASVMNLLGQIYRYLVKITRKNKST